MHIIANASEECPKCKAEVPVSSQFCPQCGHPLTEDAKSQVERKAPRWAGILLVLFVGLLAYVIVHAYNDSRSATKPIVAAAPSTMPIILPPQSLPQTQAQPQMHSIPISNGSLSVNAGSYSWYPFTVPAGASAATVTGHFQAAGGTGNDIKVYVLDEDGFVNLKNGHGTRTFYNSGTSTQATITAVLPGTSAKYYLVLDNRFSPESPKTVQVNATLSYKQ
jgi:hypothetical protein